MPTHRISGLEPNWRLPRLPEIHQLGFKQRGWSSHEISCHIQEVGVFVVIVIVINLVIADPRKRRRYRPLGRIAQAIYD